MTSLIIPCLWANRELYELTKTCLDAVWDKFDEVLVIAGGTYAQNVNKGLRAASGDYIVILNNDLEFLQPGWLDHLLKPLREGNHIASIRTTEEGWETEDRYENGAKFGSIWAITNKARKKIGLLDESFGNYFEDLDYHKRADMAGLKVVKNHAGLVGHQPKTTFKQSDPEDKQYQLARSRFEKKWGKVW